jgi:hypothetical protein
MIPRGWGLTIRLSNDGGGNVVTAEFVVGDNAGIRGNANIVLLNLTNYNNHSTAAVTWLDLAPIRAVQVTLVGPTTGAGPLVFGSTRPPRELGPSPTIALRR